MKLAWKLSIPQICIVVCVGLTSFVVVNASLNSLREQYVRDAVENRFQHIAKDIEIRGQEAVKLTSLFVRLPSVVRAYEMALGGNIDDAYSPQAQTARELLRNELAPMLDSYREQFGDKLQLHFHLPSVRSLVRLWRDKNTRIKGEALDVSDDLSAYRSTITEALKSGEKVMGIELGSGGIAIRGVIPVKAPDGRLLGTAEVLQDFQPVLEAVREEGSIELIMYVHKDRISLAATGHNPVAIATDLQDPAKNPRKGDFVRVTTPRDDAHDALITPELLSRGKDGQVVELRGAIALATLPVNDYQGTQLGVLVCAMNTAGATKLVRTAVITLAFMLAIMIIAPSIALLLGLRVWVASPLNMIKEKIQDIAEDRADLSEPIPSSQNDEIGSLANWFNILATKLRAMLDAMREADERTHIMLDATPLVASLWDKEGNGLECNQEAVTLFGLSSKGDYFERFRELSPEYQPCGRRSREMIREFSGKTFKDGYERFEWMHQTLDGEPVPCEITLVRVRYKDDVVMLGYVRDLRRLKATMAQIAAESAKFEAMAHWYESILDAIPFPISVQDTDERWTFVNAAIEKLLRKARPELLGLACSTWGVSICNTANCAIACAKRGVMQTRFFHKNASYQVDIAILKDLHGEIAGYLEVIQDISQLERMAEKQAEAVAANRAKSAFLATMSHEIRTPMNAVLGITEMQLQQETLSSNTREAFSRIYTAGYTLLGIINDILDLSKIEAGKLELMPAPYDVAILISDTVHQNAMRIGSKSLEFTLQVDEEMPLQLVGDELRIKQILSNLLSNAFKYTQEGEVMLSVAAEYGSSAADPEVTLVCRVRDTGSGMTADQVGRLFDEYSRFHVAANRLIEGTGLGMNITQHMVRMMNGEIFVESARGRGSTFTVRLPQGKLDSGKLGRELAENLRRFNVNPLHMRRTPVLCEPMPYGSVLIVDDLETNLYVGRGLLTPYDLAVDTAMSGFEAINKILAGNKYDIVFMDHMMPSMDGVETTRILRELGYDRPIVALTANAVVGQAEMFLHNGFNGFIPKPIDLRQLNAVLNRQIRDKQPPEVLEAARRQKGGLQAIDEALPPLLDAKLAKIFVRDAEKTLTTLGAIYSNKYRREDDMHLFVINVHAMKSALANIGEKALAAHAARLEQAGRKRDVDTLSAETTTFLDGLREAIEKNRPKDEGEYSQTEEDQAYLREKLLAIRAACAEYDKKTVKDALADLQQKAWSRQTREQLESIAERLLHSDFEDIADLAGQLLG